jgi:hypothetical protein
MVCKTCQSPVFKSGSYYFHDVQPRTVATIARETQEQDQQLVKTPGIVTPEKRAEVAA